MKRLLVLASGEGTTFEAIAQAIALKQIQNASLIALGCNQKKAGALERAKRLGIETFLVESKKFRGSDGKLDRPQYERALSLEIATRKPDFICLAGYMLVLGKQLIEEYSMRITNIHPSLLPKYRGMHALEQALEAGDTETGCTVHFVNELLDAGPIIKQAKVPILPGDTQPVLRQRLQPIEHHTYIESLKLLCE